MKRFLILLLAAVMVFCFAACDSESDESSSAATSSKSTSSAAASSEEESSEVASSSEETSSEATSSEATSSEEESAESSDASSGEPSITEDGETVAEFISQFFSWEGSIGNGGTVNVKTTGASSVRLTGLNTGAVDGTAAVLGFNSDYEDVTIYSEDGSYDKYEVFVFEYNHDVWGYELTESLGLDAEGKQDVEIPEDGYVVAIHSYFSDYITAIKNAADDVVFTPYGFRATNDIDATISQGTPTIDGNISQDEYGDPVWVYAPETSYVSYEQFDVNFPDEGYYSGADVYMMYDEEYLYLAVIVDSPYHYNNLESDAASLDDMYKYECIQVNICSVDPKGEYITSNWDQHEQHNGIATGKNIIRQYGFAANESNETLSHVWIGSPTSFGGTAVCLRDDENQLTYYEIALPLSECGETDATVIGEAGSVMGVSVSINSGREGKDFVNYYLRDGGGIIGRNDWTKVPQITFD